MCRNPFGGSTRLDKLDDDHLFTSDPGDGIGALCRSVILDAVNCFLFWGLGRNGYVAQEFLAAHDYLFEVTDDSTTWPVEQRIELTDEDMQSMTFPTHFEVAGFERHMTIDRFRRLLRQKRSKIVRDNRDQVKTYLRELRVQAANRGEYLRDDTRSADLDVMLLEPTPEGLAALIYPRRVTVPEAQAKVFVMPPRRERRRAA